MKRENAKDEDDEDDDDAAAPDGVKKEELGETDDEDDDLPGREDESDVRDMKYKLENLWLHGDVLSVCIVISDIFHNLEKQCVSE